MFLLEKVEGCGENSPEDRSCVEWDMGLWDRVSERPTLVFLFVELDQLFCSLEVGRIDLNDPGIWIGCGEDGRFNLLADKY